MNGSGKHVWERAQEQFQRVKQLESRGDRADPELVQARAELRRILGLPVPRVERRSKARLERRRPQLGPRRTRRRRGTDRRGSGREEPAGSPGKERNPAFQKEPRTALLDRVHRARELRRSPPVARRRGLALAEKVVQSSESAGVAKHFWRRI